MESLCGCTIPDGHPLFVMYKENDAVSKKLAALRDKLLFDEADGFDEAMEDVLCISDHYDKKAVLYPLTENKSLADEMRTEDDRILTELSFLHRDEHLHENTWDDRLLALLGSMREMLLRENNVLYPHLSQTLTEEQWVQVYYSFKEFGPYQIGVYPLWVRAEHPDAPRCACESLQNEKNQRI